MKKATPPFFVNVALLSFESMRLSALSPATRRNLVRDEGNHGYNEPDLWCSENPLLRRGHPSPLVVLAGSSLTATYFRLWLAKELATEKIYYHKKNSWQNKTPLSGCFVFLIIFL